MSDEWARIAAWADVPTERVTALGAGESYRAWRVDRDSGPVVVRVLHRPAWDLPQPMAIEYAALKRLPPDLGPAGLQLEESPEILGAPFMVQSWVPGRVLDRKAWTPALLAAHARRLAALHADGYETAGDLLDGSRSTSISLTRRAAEAEAWWREHHPEIVAGDDVAGLLARLRAEAERVEPAFVRLDRFALVHGDVVVPNVLVDALGVPRYVDWEWAAIGDPAQDLALIGGRTGVAPWSLHLDPTTLTGFLDVYATAAGLSVSEAVDLHLRRDGWERLDRTFTLLHCRRAIARTDGAVRDRYRASAAELERGLA